MDRKQPLKLEEEDISLDGPDGSSTESFEDLASCTQVVGETPSPSQIVGEPESSCFKSGNKTKKQPSLCDCSTRCGTRVQPVKDFQSAHLGKETAAALDTYEPAKMVAEMNEHYEKRVKGSNSVPSTDQPHNVSPAQSIKQSTTPMSPLLTVPAKCENNRRLRQPESPEQTRALRREKQEDLDNERQILIVRDSDTDDTAQPDHGAYAIPGEWPHVNPKAFVARDSYLTGEVDFDSNAQHEDSRATYSRKMSRRRKPCPNCRCERKHTNVSHSNPWEVRQKIFSDDEICLVVGAPVVTFLLTLPAGLLASAHIRGSHGQGNEVTLIFCFTVIFGSFMSMYVQVKKPEMWSASYAAVLVIIWCILRIK